MQGGGGGRRVAHLLTNIPNELRRSLWNSRRSVLWDPLEPQQADLQVLGFGSLKKSTDISCPLNPVGSITSDPMSSPILPPFFHLHVTEIPSPRNKVLIPKSSQGPYQVSKGSRPSSSCVIGSKLFSLLGYRFLICKVRGPFL